MYSIPFARLQVDTTADLILAIGNVIGSLRIAGLATTLNEHNRQENRS